MDRRHCFPLGPRVWPDFVVQAFQPALDRVAGTLRVPTARGACLLLWTARAGWKACAKVRGATEYGHTLHSRTREILLYFAVKRI